MTEEKIKLKKEIRLLEIELDYLEETNSKNFKYLRELNKKIDDLYRVLESDETN
jgi:hypothetical protein